MVSAYITPSDVQKFRSGLSTSDLIGNSTRLSAQANVGDTHLILSPATTVALNAYDSVWARGDMENLHQATALCPFMKQFVTLAYIARRASNDKVGWVIATTMSERDHMVNMIGVLTFAQLSRAIVALATLTLILLLNIMNGMRSLSIATQSTSVERVYPYLFGILATPFLLRSARLFGMLLPAFSVSFLLLGDMKSIIVALVRVYPVSILLSVSLLFGRGFLWMVFVPLLVLFIQPFAVVCIVSIAHDMLTVFAATLQSVRSTLVLAKGGGQFDLLALRTAFMPFWENIGYQGMGFTPLMLLCVAFLATFGQTILSVLVSIKERRGSRFPCLAMGTLFLRGILGYDVHMGETTFHPSRRGMFQHRHGSTLLPSYYTTKPHGRLACE